jgi:hypothetical protein
MSGLQTESTGSKDRLASFEKLLSGMALATGSSDGGFLGKTGG